MARLSYQDVKITSGATTSLEVDLRNHRLVAIDTPAALTSTALTFLSCITPDGVVNHPATETFDPVADDAGAAVSITVAASKYIVLSTAVRDKLAGLGRCKLVCGSAEGADRYITLVVEPRDAMS